jgi:hypothetical protein
MVFLSTVSFNVWTPTFAQALDSRIQFYFTKEDCIVVWRHESRELNEEIGRFPGEFLIRPQCSADLYTELNFFLQLVLHDPCYRPSDVAFFMAALVCFRIFTIKPSRFFFISQRLLENFQQCTDISTNTIKGTSGNVKQS